MHADKFRYAYVIIANVDAFSEFLFDSGTGSFKSVIPKMKVTKLRSVQVHKLLYSIENILVDTAVFFLSILQV